MRRRGMFRWWGVEGRGTSRSAGGAVEGKGFRLTQIRETMAPMHVDVFEGCDEFGWTFDQKSRLSGYVH